MGTVNSLKWLPWARSIFKRHVVGKEFTIAAKSGEKPRLGITEAQNRKLHIGRWVPSFLRSFQRSKIIKLY